MPCPDSTTDQTNTADATARAFDALMRAVREADVFDDAMFDAEQRGDALEAAANRGALDQAQAKARARFLALFVGVTQ